MSSLRQLLNIAHPILIRDLPSAEDVMRTIVEEAASVMKSLGQRVATRSA